MKRTLTSALRCSERLKKEFSDLKAPNPQDYDIVLLLDEINRLKSLNTETDKDKKSLHFHVRLHENMAGFSHRRRDDPPPKQGEVLKVLKVDRPVADIKNNTRRTETRLPFGMNPGDVGFSEPGLLDVKISGTWKPKSAIDLLRAATKHMEDRAVTYDSEGGERSIPATVVAFNAITKHKLTDSEGWLFQQILKDVRQWSSKGYHADSAEDSIAYAALKGESLAEGN